MEIGLFNLNWFAKRSRYARYHLLTGGTKYLQGSNSREKIDAYRNLWGKSWGDVSNRILKAKQANINTIGRGRRNLQEIEKEIQNHISQLDLINNDPSSWFWFTFLHSLGFRIKLFNERGLKQNNWLSWLWVELNVDRFLEMGLEYIPMTNPQTTYFPSFKISTGNIITAWLSYLRTSASFTERDFNKYMRRVERSKWQLITSPWRLKDTLDRIWTKEREWQNTFEEKLRIKKLIEQWRAKYDQGMQGYIRRMAANEDVQHYCASRGISILEFTSKYEESSKEARDLNSSIKKKSKRAKHLKAEVNNLKLNLFRQNVHEIFLKNAIELQNEGVKLQKLNKFLKIAEKDQLFKQHTELYILSLINGKYDSLRIGKEDCKEGKFGAFLIGKNTTVRLKIPEHQIQKYDILEENLPQKHSAFMVPTSLKSNRFEQLKLLYNLNDNDLSFLCKLTEDDWNYFKDTISDYLEESHHAIPWSGKENVLVKYLASKILAWEDILSLHSMACQEHKLNIEGFNKMLKRLESFLENADMTPEKIDTAMQKMNELESLNVEEIMKKKKDGLIYWEYDYDPNTHMVILGKDKKKIYVDPQCWEKLTTLDQEGFITQSMNPNSTNDNFKNEIEKSLYNKVVNAIQAQRHPSNARQSVEEIINQIKEEYSRSLIEVHDYMQDMSAKRRNESKESSPEVAGKYLIQDDLAQSIDKLKEETTTTIRVKNKDKKRQDLTNRDEQQKIIDQKTKKLNKTMNAIDAQKKQLKKIGNLPEVNVELTPEEKAYKDQSISEMKEIQQEVGHDQDEQVKNEDDYGEINETLKKIETSAVLQLIANTKVEVPNPNSTLSPTQESELRYESNRSIMTQITNDLMGNQLVDYTDERSKIEAPASIFQKDWTVALSNNKINPQLAQVGYNIAKDLSLPGSLNHTPKPPQEVINEIHDKSGGKYNAAANNAIERIRGDLIENDTFEIWGLLAMWFIKMNAAEEWYLMSPLGAYISWNVVLARDIQQRSQLILAFNFDISNLIKMGMTFPKWPYISLDMRLRQDNELNIRPNTPNNLWGVLRGVHHPNGLANLVIYGQNRWVELKEKLIRKLL